MIVYVIIVAAWVLVELKNLQVKFPVPLSILQQFLHQTTGNIPSNPFLHTTILEATYFTNIMEKYGNIFMNENVIIEL